MRKLATIQTISSIGPIPGADAIEKVRVLGWWVVVKKGEYKPGDKIVYCEIDSLLPERPEFEFLRASSFRAASDVLPAGFRVKTFKARGQVSQGICFPLSILPPGTAIEEGVDVSKELGVIKWEIPPTVGMTGRTKGKFPCFLPKTDETRVQSLESTLERNRGKLFYVTEKLDGTSFTAFIRDGEFGICSRNLWLDETDESHALCRLAKEMEIEEKLRFASEFLGHELAIQGEVIGPKIQGNKYEQKHNSLWVFNVLDVNTARLLDYDWGSNVLKNLLLDQVPLISRTLLEYTVDELVELSIGPSQLNAKIQREGIVLRPIKEEYDKEIGGRLSFKVINPKFLLKYDE